MRDPALRQEIAAVGPEDMGWLRSVETLYRNLEGARHHVTPLPQIAPERRNSDLLHAEWDEHRYDRYPLMATAAAEAGSIVRFAQLLKLSASAGDRRPTPRHALA